MSKENEKPKQVSKYKQIGKYLMGLCFLMLIIGRVVARIFFPESQGKGVTNGLLMILIPIWSIGIAGLLMFIVGWSQEKK